MRHGDRDRPVATRKADDNARIIARRTLAIARRWRPLDRVSGPGWRPVIVSVECRATFTTGCYARCVRLLGLDVGERRVGHTGTLDPFASGLLVLLVGPVTRLAEYLSALPKRYEARARVGIRTDTHDAEGSTVSVQDFGDDLSREQIEAELAGFVGCGQQVPPQFSAKKVDGERMYKRARRGERVRLASVDVEIFDLRLTDFAPPQICFTMACSSGCPVPG